LTRRRVLPHMPADRRTHRHAQPPRAQPPGSCAPSSPSASPGARDGSVNRGETRRDAL